MSVHAVTWAFACIDLPASLACIDLHHHSYPRLCGHASLTLTHSHPHRPWSRSPTSMHSYAPSLTTHQSLTHHHLPSPTHAGPGHVCQHPRQRCLGPVGVCLHDRVLPVRTTGEITMRYLLFVVVMHLPVLVARRYAPCRHALVVLTTSFIGFLFQLNKANAIRRNTCKACAPSPRRC